MIVESRLYHVHPGRLPALLKRFETATLKYFARHGFQPAGFYTDKDDAEGTELTYFLKWKDMEERERCWATFRADPDWVKAVDDSQKDGKIVREVVTKFLVPTSFSS